MENPLGSRLHFKMPPDLESFPLFSKLPYEIRYKIWREAMYIPGIHFLKFEPTQSQLAQAISNRASDPNDDDADNDGADNDDDDDDYTAKLMSTFPRPGDDLSYHITATKERAMLMLSCKEAAILVNKAMNKPGKLELDDKRLITLAGSDDVICIDCPNLTFPRTLRVWDYKLNQTQLDAIRCLAVRYHFSWDTSGRRCGTCGVVLQAHEMNSYWRLYEFAALFKNLERFHFVDCTAIEYSSATTTALDTPYPMRRFMAPHHYAPDQELLKNAGDRKFLSGGRTYHELNTEDWQLSSNASNVLSFMRHEYLKYCQKYPEKTHKDPANVRFWVLGCGSVPEHRVPEHRNHRQKKGSPTKTLAHIAKILGRLRLDAGKQDGVKEDEKRRDEKKGNEEKGDEEKGDGEKGDRTGLDQRAGLPMRFGDKDATFKFQFNVRR